MHLTSARRRIAAAALVTAGMAMTVGLPAAGAQGQLRSWASREGAGSTGEEDFMTHARFRLVCATNGAPQNGSDARPTSS
jgi:hypothetical protein